MNDTLIDLVEMDCPLCDEIHHVEKRERRATAMIKDDKVTYKLQYYRCPNCDEGEDEFIPAKLMDENLLSARNAYRMKHQLLTSQEIIELRKKYGLTQKELALMLGWGEITVSRYEKKLIQDETHDDILKTIREDALEARKYLQRNHGSFSETRYNEIMAQINAEIQKTSTSFLGKKQIEAQYIPYQGNIDANGGTKLDIDKVRNMMMFFACRCSELFKVKLMKLLWYSDALYYKKYHVGMSGLVYQHMPMGALPVAHWDFMKLIKIETITNEDIETVSYRICPVENFDETVFNTQEIEVLNSVAAKFSSYTGNQLAEYMHQESAYKNTKMYDIIPYSLADNIRIF